MDAYSFDFATLDGRVFVSHQQWQLSPPWTLDRHKCNGNFLLWHLRPRSRVVPCGRDGILHV